MSNDNNPRGDPNCSKKKRYNFTLSDTHNELLNTIAKHNNLKRSPMIEKIIEDYFVMEKIVAEYQAKN